MTQTLSRHGLPATDRLTVLPLDDVPGWDISTLDVLRSLAGRPAGLALLVLTGGRGDLSPGRHGYGRDGRPDHPNGGAALTSGRTAAQRTGDDGGLLDQAWAQAESSGDEQQMTAVACARAESAWIAGRIDRLRTEAQRGRQLAVAHSDGWALGELNWWLSRAGCAPERRGRLPAPFRLMLEGRWREAAAFWLAHGRPLWAAYGLGCSPSLPDARRALALADDLGATAARQAIVRQRRAGGLPVPPRPRATTRANPLQLTRRESEVLDLLTDGLTNQQIATRLYLSERTVAHHVSAVLHKLDQPNRSAAAVAAVRQGIVPLTRSAG